MNLSLHTGLLGALEAGLIAFAIGVLVYALWSWVCRRTGLAVGYAIGWGAVRHRMAAPFVVAMTGLTFMGGALAVPHGVEEAVLTIIGVALVALGHVLNLRHLRGACTHGCTH